MKRSKRSQSKRARRGPGRGPGHGGGRHLDVTWDEPPRFAVPIPKDEPERLADLRSFKVLDTPPEEDFDAIALLASHICQTPIALISLIDSDRQWFKSKVGLSVSETSRDVALCAHAIMQHDLFIVPDASQDERFAKNPLVTSNPKIRFYAGAPLVSPDQHALGTLCVMDRVPRELKPEQIEALRALSRLAMAQLTRRRQMEELRQALHEQRRATRNEQKARALAEADQNARAELLSKASHEARVTLGEMASLVDQVLATGLASKQRNCLNTLRSQVASLTNLLHEVGVHSRPGGVAR